MRGSHYYVCHIDRLPWRYRNQTLPEVHIAGLMCRDRIAPCRHIYELIVSDLVGDTIPRRTAIEIRSR